MGKIGDVYYQVGLDTSGLPVLAKKEGAKAGDQFGKSMSSKLKANLKGGLAQGLGIGVGFGGVQALTAGLGALTDEVFKSIDAASDQREAMSLNDQVFKDSAGTIEAWADTAAESFGESKRSAVNFASGFGNALKAAELPMDDMAKRSMELTERAADLGSAFNATGEEVATAIKSGLVGESEPLRRFGVLLSDAAVRAEAVESGIAHVGEELTEGQKILARYNLILKQSSDSAGMFGRDTESLADPQKQLNAMLEDIHATIGIKLLPVMVALSRWARDEGVPALEELIAAVEDAGPVFEALGDIVGIVTSAGGSGMQFYQDQVREGLEAVEANIESSTQSVIAGVANKNRDYQTVSEKFAGELPTAVEDAKDRTVRIASMTPQEIADALRDGRAAWQTAVDQLADDLENRMSTAAEIAKIKAELAGDNLKRGLKSKDPVVKAQALATQKILTDRLNALQGIAGVAGALVGIALAASLRGGIPVVRSAANALSRAATVRPPGSPSGPQERHAGGPVEAGTPYIVGRTGAEELFVPDVPGYIYPTVPSGVQPVTTNNIDSGDVVINLVDKGVEVRSVRDIASVTKMYRNQGYFRKRNW